MALPHLFRYRRKPSQAAWLHLHLPLPLVAKLLQAPAAFHMGACLHGKRCCMALHTP